MFIEIPNIKIKSIAACVPANIVENTDSRLIEYTGIERRRVSDYCASDLCFEAAKGIKDIDVLVFVSQTADYSIPATSVILQHRLGLRSIMAFDINMSCSGWVYGLSVVASLLSANNKRGLLLAGDTLSRVCSKEDRSTYPLFGDCGTATYLEYEPGEGLKFQLGSDGAGYKAIIIPDSGMRNPVNKASFETETYPDGVKRNSTQLAMDGLGVFFFALKRVPESIKQLILNYSLTDIDYFVLHQSNKLMIEGIAKKLNTDRVPMSLKDFGNTSSASIPLTLLTNNIKGNIIACGYGAGLSWGSVHMNLDCEYSKLIEI